MTAPKRSSSKASAILSWKCPNCREGELFESPLFSIRFSRMHKECPNCGQDFVIEPGFYFGASYFSYAINVAVIFICILGYFIWFDAYSEWYLIGFIVVLTLVLMPLNFRLSRSLMLHLFGGI